MRLIFFIRKFASKVVLNLVSGDTLLRVSESEAVPSGRATLRRLLPECGSCRRGSLVAPERNHGNQNALQHVHVQS